MTTMIREPECVVLKRRGAEHVAKLIAGMNLQEQLDFWRKRTEAMLARQEISHQYNTVAYNADDQQPDPPEGLSRNDRKAVAFRPASLK